MQLIETQISNLQEIKQLIDAPTLKQEELIEKALREKYDYDEFYFAELLHVLDIGQQVIDLLSPIECDSKNIPTKYRFLEQAYQKIGNQTEEEKYRELYLKAE